ncbi:alpha/beta fold hydrolase [Bradyrhizobium sp. 184]|uniref:alpha/beta fold hydrolase n=1 Tax=Bradyrhizobium sp. 184 TaxID=2782653 RepID=UPI003530220D
MIHWDDAFCEQLAAHGFRVIRFDNRDIGKSSHLTGGKRLTPLELLKLRFLRIPVAATYKLIDMAKDTVGLMDALGVKSAHLVGASMGGMIAQEVTLSFPERVALAHLDHVDDRQSAPAAPDTRGRRDADGAAAAQQGGVHRPLRPDLERVAGRVLPGGRGARSRSCRARVRARAQSGRCRPAAPRGARLG